MFAAILALATILGFEVWSLDVKHAYLQSAPKLRREIFTRPESAELEKNELLQVVRPLYVLRDSSDYWYETSSRFHLDKLRMQMSTGDFAFFFKRLSSHLVTVSGFYVDDIVQARTSEQKGILRNLFAKKFDLKISGAQKLTYMGMEPDT